MPVQLHEYVAPLSPHVGIARSELDGFVESRERFFVASELLQRGSKAYQVTGLGILPNSAGDPLDRVRVLPGMQGQQSQEMQAVGVPGICLERLLTAELRREVPPGAEMIKARLVERARRARRGWLRGRFGTFRGRPALATIHRHVTSLVYSRL